MGERNGRQPGMGEIAMTKKDYVLIAAALARCRIRAAHRDDEIMIEIAARELALALAAANPHFVRRHVEV